MRPPLRQTHTFAVLEISAAAFREIRQKLEAADYHHAIQDGPDGAVIDMHGIGVAAERAIDPAAGCTPERGDPEVGR